MSLLMKTKPLTVALVLLWAVAPMGADYLRERRPAPLRWAETPPVNPEALKRLPPLSTGREPSAEDASNAALFPGGISSATNDLSPGPVVGGIGDEGLIGPVLPIPSGVITNLFYSPAVSNRVPASVMPLEFMPPVPFGPPSSSATYSTDKP